MSFTESIKTCFNKYVTFRGRATRSEYWWFWLFINVLGMLPLLILALFNAVAMFFASIATTLAISLPAWSVAVRRLHDTNHSGWWLLCPVYPIILMFMKGSEGENDYGAGESDLQLTCPICAELVDASASVCPHCGEATHFDLAEPASGTDRKVAIGVIAFCGLLLIGGIAFSFSDIGKVITGEDYDLSEFGGYDLSEDEDYDLAVADTVEAVIDDVYSAEEISVIGDEDGFIQEFEGAIGKYPIKMVLNLTDITNYDYCRVVGKYRYTETGEGGVLDLYGEKRGNHLVLKEYSDGKVTGTFSGTFMIYGNLASFEYSGTFTTSQGKSFEFDLHSNY